MAWTLVNSQAITFADGGTGHVYTIPSGAPSSGNLDVLCVNSDTVISSVASSGGASWVEGPHFVSNQDAQLWYRVATGGEPATVTVTTSTNDHTFLGWSRWTAGTITADQTALGHVDLGFVTTTPAATTGALAATGELSIAFAALHNMQVSAPTSPVWSANYTELETASSGTTSTDVTSFVGYNNNAGTAAESPNVSWTTDTADAYMLVQTFKTVSPPPPVTPPTVLYSMRMMP